MRIKSKRPLKTASTIALQQWAKANEITPARLDHEAGLSRSQASLLLNGRASVTIHTILKLEPVYGSVSIQPIKDAFFSEKMGKSHVQACIE